MIDALRSRPIDEIDRRQQQSKPTNKIETTTPFHFPQIFEARA
jgi:hypothetical protein